MRDVCTTGFMAIALAAFLTAEASAQDLTGQPSGPARGGAVNEARPGMSYHEVRARLDELGWSPARFTDPGRCGARTTICEAYSEVGSCAGTGRAPCLFVFFAQGAEGFSRVLTVTTQGEERLGRPPGRDLKVTAITWATRAEARDFAPFYKP